MDLLKDLNPEQLKAVTQRDGPMLIVAGAGTGKTTAITRRIAYLIEQGRAGAEEILALTFTDKAAGEMSERVDALLPYGYFDLWISTFHGFAERLIKVHGLAIGLSTDFKLLNNFEQWALVKKNLDKFNLDYYRPLGNPTKFIHALLKHFSRAKDEDLGPLQYLEYASGLKQNLDGMLSGASKLSLRGSVSDRSNPRSSGTYVDFHRRLLRPDDSGLAMTESTDEQEAARLNEVANAYHAYQQLLLDSNALDFGDLINYTLKLFRERPAILEKYRRQFKYILVDEFQDTNRAQYELVKLLCAPKNNLTVVGDDDQSVYKFRGASLSNILQFNKDFPKAEKIMLTKNYRSRQNILDLAYEFIKQNNPNRLEWQLENLKPETPLIPLYKGDKVSFNPPFKRGAGGLSKKLIAQEKGLGEIEVIQGADLAEEIKLVADKICELKLSDKQASWNDFAILVRANGAADDFMNEFDRRGLAYIFGASRGLYAKPVVMDAIAYLKLLDNYHESAALYRVLNLPVFNFSERELIDFNHLAHKKAWSLYEVLNNAEILKLDAETRKKITPLLSLVAKHSALAREKSASEVFFAFMSDSGYLKYLSGAEKNLEAIGLLNQFLKRIKEFEGAGADKSVKAFLSELALEMEAGEEGALAADPEAGPEAIKILTAHGAKGLEFKYVFIANLVDKRFPTIERKEPIELPDALVKEILPEGDAHLEEERRLFYVAMTRAKQGLYFSWAEDYGGARGKKPSRFLMELGLVDKVSKGSNPPLSPLLKGGRGVKISGADLLAKGGAMPAHFSYSQLAAYSACPYQYRFAHVLKIPTMGKEQFSFGKTMHSTLQKLFFLLAEKKGLGQADLFSIPKTLGVLRTPSVSFGELLKLYEQSWIDDWYASRQSKEERKKQGREILKEFYEKYKNNWPEVLFLEKNFNWKIVSGAEAYTVRGAIDRIDKIPSGLKLVDYKTGAAKNKLSFEEKEQLLIYQLAAGELFKEPVAALAFYYLEDNSEVEFLGTAAELEKVKAKIIETVKRIKAGQFPPRPGRLCSFCDYREICEFRA
ncbi:MAG: UvrD-helicase domain-containing protein [bacterium]|nr:UvrD-helicase domain-containing protein [bacterium]